MGINAGQMAGKFEDIAAATGQKISAGNIIQLFDGTEYLTSLVDEGGAIPLANGVFANLIPSSGGLQPGDNVSELMNDAGYLTSVPVATETTFGGFKYTFVGGVLNLITV